MPRPSEQGQAGLHGNDSFTPGGPSNYTTQVVAPLDVDAAPTQAKMLAAALGKANDSMQPTLGLMAREKGMSDEGAGEAAAALGKDAAEAQAGHNYGAGFMVGFTKVDTQKRAFGAVQEAQQFAAANPNMTPAELAQNIDGIFKKTFPDGEEKNPEQAKAMAPILTHTIQELTGQRNLQFIKGAQQAAEDTATSNLMFEIQRDSTQFSNPAVAAKWRSDALDTANKIYGPDKRGAVSSLVHSVGAAAVNAANPDVINQILPANLDFGGGARLRPEDIHYLDAARTQATEAQARANKANIDKAQGAITLGMLNGKDPLPALKQLANQPGFNSDWAMHAISWFYQRGKEKDSDALDNSHIQFDMLAAISKRDITQPAELLSWLQDRGITGGKVGNAILKAGLNEVHASQNIEASDIDYRTGLANIEGMYAPTRGPLGQILNDAARQQQVGAMTDFRTEYSKQLSNGANTIDATRIATKNVQEKWGAKVGDTAKPNQQMPQTDNDQAQVIRDAWKDPGSFHKSGISPNDINRLYSLGMIEKADHDRAQQMIIDLTKPK